MSNNTKTPPVLWEPTESFRQNSHLSKYIKWLSEKHGKDFENYEALYQWSVNELEEFWQSTWDYFEVIAHKPYTAVLESAAMPGARWFSGSELNYAEHIFRMRDDTRPAIIFASERHEPIEIGWPELSSQVASMAAFLKSQGVKKGDRVAAFLPNMPEATYAFLATASIGAIWSSCSPDFGVNSVVDRFAQIEPKVLFAVDGYSYNGKHFDKMAAVEEMTGRLPTVEKVVLVPYLNDEPEIFDRSKATLWNDTFTADSELAFTPVPFDHPIYILYSSGTTGIPKAITHSHGGNLLEHLKYLHFHNDVHPGERFFWFSTTGWMMWNFVHASMLAGATIVLYDGSPGFPDLNRLWKLAEEVGIHHFGTSAPFLVANRKQGLQPGVDFDLSALRSIGSTGSPLPPEAFEYVYEKIKKDVWLCSMAGGTDVCTAWVGGNPLLPVYKGEIQCRCLGAAIEAWNESGQSVVDEVAELVVTKPMPSMPVFFWGDENYERYKSSYFDVYPGVWRHGDWITLTSRGTIVIWGRSDATLNRQGVRIGTAEVYRAVDKVPEVSDSLIVNLELPGGRDYMPLFVVLKEDQALSEELVKKIKTTLRSECSPRHVPDEIIQVTEIPYTISGKKMEAPVKKILLGKPLEKAANKDSMRNPDSLKFFIEFREKLKEKLEF
ncbi:MAG: acetoacetate--CoA ligase [Saprospiraceae bacterium]